MKETRVLGVMVHNPGEGSKKIQNILTMYGCNIRTRLGLHDSVGEYAADTGLMLLELTGDASECAKLENELFSLDGVEVQKMVFVRR